MKCARALFQQVGGLFQDVRAAFGRRPAPGLESVARARRSRAFASAGCRIGDARSGCRRSASRRPPRARSVQCRALAEFDAARILALRPVEIARQRDVRMPRVVGAADDVGRPPQQRRDRHGLVGGKRDKGRVGAVLQQPPHQIGQQIAVAADRRVGAAGESGTILGSIARRALRPCHAGAGIRIRLRRRPVRERSRPSARCGWRIAEKCAAAAPAVFARRRRSSGRSSPCG